MEKIKKIIKDNYKFTLVLIILAIIFLCPLPYYIDAPGGLTNLSEKVIIEDKKIDGSYNLSYVEEYKATLPILIYAYFNKDLDIYKKSDVMSSLSDDEYNKRDRLYLEQSLSNAIIASYNLASKKIKINESYLYVGYKVEESQTDLKVGDKILKVDGKLVSSKEEINKILNTKNTNDKIEIEVENNGNNYIRTALVITENNKNLIGIVPIEVIDYETDPEVTIKMSKNESGGSGGLMLSLAIYDLLVDENVSNGKKIAGTGTIDRDGNVGVIGGIEYKIKGAVKSKADVFFVPSGNFKEAKKVIKDNNYNLNLIEVETLKDAIEYLRTLN